MTSAIAFLLGCVLDAFFGEPRRAHPLVGFGWYANRIERLLNINTAPLLRARALGLTALLFAVVPFVLLACWLGRLPYGWLADALFLYLALGARSLGEHARAIAVPLVAGDLAAARTALARIVSRDTSELDTAGVASATLESVLENGNDAIFGTLFWFALLGGPGAVMFRLANTLDAMWGYRTPRFLHFGWAAARFDDVLNYAPARLTAISYALLGQCRQALACWRVQAPMWDSPNAGPVMATGAGALGVQLGGPARYHGEWEQRPALGCGARPAASDIARGLNLVCHTQCLWCAILFALLVIKGRYV